MPNAVLCGSCTAIVANLEELLCVFGIFSTEVVDASPGRTLLVICLTLCCATAQDLYSGSIVNGRTNIPVWSMLGQLGYTGFLVLFVFGCILLILVTKNGCRYGK
uniref:Uncharacterized protein n=1 Tax=Arundo donax TaxID=35708 RepID=A0A0A9FG81_ARUDO